jgi:anti-anti-sigma factor
MNFHHGMATIVTCQRNDTTMPIAIESHGTVAILRPQGDIDKEVAGELHALMEAATDDGAAHLIVDLSAVTHVGSDGLKAIVGIVRRLQPIAGSVMLASVRDSVRSLLAAGGFLVLLREFDDVDAAMQAVAAGRQAEQRG